MHINLLNLRHSGKLAEVQEQDRHHNGGSLSPKEGWHSLQGNEWCCKEDPILMS